MADYAVIGRKGAGKTLTCIGIIRDALIKGKRVATNVDIHLDKLMLPESRKTITRVPDHPTVEDLVLIGRGQDGVIEEDNGILVLDEASHYLNARQFQDKSRLSTLEWLTQSRKYGWDVYYIVQGLPQIDKQVRETQLEYVVNIKRTDKWPIPFITPITAFLFGDEHAIRFPKLRLAITKHGVERDSLVVSRKFYKAKELYPCYDTQQLFMHREHPDAVGVHTKLSAWHLKGRYMPPKPTKITYLKLCLYLAVLFAQKLTRTEIDTYRLLTHKARI
jgi:hypothetical protein